jgi:hypothetical protein
MVMRKSLLVLRVFVICFGLAAPHSSFAIENQTTIRPAKPVKMSPSALTSGECRGLGGKVGANNKCSVGAECLTTDSDGVVHRACLTKL